MHGVNIKVKAISSVFAGILSYNVQYKQLTVHKLITIASTHF